MIVISHVKLQAFMKSNNWLEFDTYLSGGDAWWLVLVAILRSVMPVLRNVAQRPPRRVVVELDKDGNKISSLDSSGVPASTLFAKQSVMYSHISWLELGKWPHSTQTVTVWCCGK